MKNAYGYGIAACLLLLATPPGAAAQGLDVRLNPRIGLYEPLSELGEFQEAGQAVASEMSGSLALGLGAELDLPILPVGVRLNLDYATGSEVTRTADGVDLGEPVETTLLAVVGDVVFRPLPRLVVVQPYLFAGGGLKQYDVDAETTPASFREASDPTLHLGGGLDVGLGPLAVNAEIGDYISRYQLEEDGDSETQHDLFLTVGFWIGLL